MYFVVACAAAGTSLPMLPALSLFDDGALSLWRDYARALTRERQLAWDELDARAIAEARLAELIAAVNALASERDAAGRRIGASRRLMCRPSSPGRSGAGRLASGSRIAVRARMVPPAVLPSEAPADPRGAFRRRHRSCLSQSGGDAPLH
jgi:hypothetical protein